MKSCILFYGILYLLVQAFPGGCSGENQEGNRIKKDGSYEVLKEPVTNFLALSMNSQREKKHFRIEDILSTPAQKPQVLQKFQQLSILYFHNRKQQLPLLPIKLLPSAVHHTPRTEMNALSTISQLFIMNFLDIYHQNHCRC